MLAAYKYRLDRLNWNETFHVCLFENGLMVLPSGGLRKDDLPLSSGLKTNI
ncbi:unnamed protein product [Camellia sinensis]